MSTLNEEAYAAPLGTGHHTAETHEYEMSDPQMQFATSPPRQRSVLVEDDRWGSAIASLRSSVLDNPNYAPDVLIQRERARMARRRRASIKATALGCLTVAAFVGWFVAGRGTAQAHRWVKIQRDQEPIAPVSLADGSVVLLSTHSQVRVNLSESERQVVLDNGEASFDVSPDASRAFDVEAGAVKVHALETAFSIKKGFDGQVETAVRRGSVEVESGGDSSLPSGASAQSPKVQAGEVATIDSAGRLNVAKVDAAELAHRLAWANPIYPVNGMTLHEVVEQFNRYNVLKLEVPDTELGKTHLTGRFYLTEPEKFVDALQQLGIDHVIRDSDSGQGERILLLRK